jgi:hypothetical protein
MSPLRAIFVSPSVRWCSYASLAAVRVWVAMRYSRREHVEPAAALFEQVRVHYVAVIASVVNIQIAGSVAATRQRFVDLILDHFKIPPSAYERISFESGWLPSYRLTPAQPKGALVVFGGFDSYIEEWMPAALFFRDAGYDTLLFEGPGQGAALELAHLTMSSEWQKPVKAVLDFFHLDAVTLMGFSLGGGLVIRTAAFEPRARRVIAYDVTSRVRPEGARQASSLT